MRLTGNTRAVLETLLGDPARPRWGTELAHELGVAQGVLYPVVTRLRKAGWIAVEREEGDPRELGRPLRSLFVLTGTGRAEAAALLAARPRPGVAGGEPSTDVLADGIVFDAETKDLIRARVPVDAAGGLLLAPIPGRGGLLVKMAGTHQVQVVMRAFNWRIQWCPNLDPVFAQRFWCYTGRSGTSLVTAVLAAAVWDGAPGTEPVGWGKNGQTGEYGPSVGSFLRHAL